MNPQLAAFLAVLRRYPYCAVCLLVTILCGVGAWYLSGDIDEAKVVLEDRSKEGGAMLETLVGGSTQRQELATVREIGRRIEDNLVGEALAENYWYFYKIEEQTKARMPDLHELNTPLTGNSPLFRRVPYTLRITGSFEQVGAFVSALETGPRLAKINSFAFARGANAITVDLNLEMLGRK